ncbi:MAG: disulfide bond formation protein B [Pseudomonadota bacterium]
MTLSSRTLAGVSLAVMVAALATAWGFQLIGNFTPCPLCLEQRVPYYVGIPLGLVALFLIGRVPTLGRLFMLGAAAAMVWTVGLGVYHAGAEWAFWPGPDTCGGGEAVTDASNLLAAIEQSTFVSCTDVQGRILGLSFAGWNVVAAGFAALVMLAAAFAPRAPRAADDAHTAVSRA